MFDLVFRGVQVFDGTGADAFVADVGVHRGRLVLMRPTAGAHARRTVDADGLALAPGFIDLHSHADLTLPSFPQARNSIQQGVTTEVVGHCGFSAAPVVPEHADELRRLVHGLSPHLDLLWRTFGEYLHTLDLRRPPVNVVALVGHGALRLGAMGFEARAPRPVELDRMGDLLRHALTEGAWGLSTGLDYAPGAFARWEELLALGRILSERDGLYVTHIRGESPTVLDALAEATSIGEAAGIRLQVSHLNSSAAVWRAVPAALQALEAARARSVIVHADAYPYRAGSTYLSQLLPTWTAEGGPEALVARLRASDQRARIRAEMERAGPSGPLRTVDFDDVLITAVVLEGNKRWEGMALSQAAAASSKGPYDFLFDLLVEEQAGTVMALFMMREEDVRDTLAWEHTAIGSDQLGVASDTSRVHPRAYGTFVRVLGRYAREEKLFSWPEAVRKMTGLPASILGLTDRGLVRDGMAADVVVFDAAHVVDRSTYGQPTLAPVGIEFVVVNGELVVDGGQLTGTRAGRVLPPPHSSGFRDARRR